MPPIIFRCQASGSIGLGHLMRCRELARALRERGRDSVLIGPEDGLLTEHDRLLFAACYPVENYVSPTADLKRVLSIAAAHGASFVVMDDYRVDPEYGSALKASGIRFLQQFDASRPCVFHADILVNAGPYEKPHHYTEFLANPRTRLLLGPQYAVLRPDFQMVAPRAAAREVGRVLVCFGGGDDRGAIEMTVEAMSAQHGAGMRVDVISGGGNPHKDRIGTALAPLRKDGIFFHVDAKNVAELMRQADLAVIAGGTMSYETAICSLPSILIAMAGNQIRSCRGWNEATGAPFLGTIDQLNSRQIGEALALLIDDHGLRASIATSARSLVDGKGVARMIDAIIEVERE